MVRQAGLTAAQLRSVDLSSWTPDLWLLSGSCAALLLGYFVHGYLWGRIVTGLGGPSLGPFESVRIFMVANLGRYVPGKVWQMAGLVALARGRGVPPAQATGAAVLGQGVGLAAATLVGLLSLRTSGLGEPWAWIVPLLLLGGVGLALIPRVFRGLLATWFRLARAEAPEELGPRRAIAWLLVGLSAWMVYGVAFWALVEGLGHDVSLLPTASAFAAAYVLGYVMVFAPAGIGVREGFLVAFLAPQVGAGAAGAIAVVARLWTTLLEVIPAAAFWTRHLVTTHGATET